MTPFKAFRDQLGKLQRLAQPYFLPLDNGASSGQFLLLVVALIAVVVGFTLLLLTAVMGCVHDQSHELATYQPASAGRLLTGY